MSLSPLNDMVIIKIPQDGSEVFNRLDQNMQHFKINYMILCVLITTISLSVINPYFLIAVALLGGIAAFLLMSKDPIKVGDDFLKINVLARVYLLLAIIFYSSFGGMAFLISIAASFVLCVIHAIICDVEATRNVKGLSSTIKSTNASETEKNINYLIARGYELLCVAIGLKESNEVYNMASVPGFVVKEIKDDVKNLKNSIKTIFKE